MLIKTFKKISGVGRVMKGGCLKGPRLRNCFSLVSAGGKCNSRCWHSCAGSGPAGRFLLSLVFLLLAWCLLASSWIASACRAASFSRSVSPHCLRSACACVQVSLLCKDAIQFGLGPTPVTSFSFNYFKRS